jgi:hypothetical protein
MEYIDLTPALVKKMKSYARILGRYNASEIHSILKGYVTPEEWITAKPREPRELMKMYKGIHGHQMVQDLLKKNLCENKKVATYKDISIVAKADYLPDEQYIEEVWEFKTSDELMEEAKKSHEHQAKMYCTMFERPRGVVLQPVEGDNSFLLRRLGVVERDDAWFQKQCEELYKFHLQVVRVWNKEDLPF